MMDAFSPCFELNLIEAASRSSKRNPQRPKIEQNVPKIGHNPGIDTFLGFRAEEAQCEANDPEGRTDRVAEVDDPEISVFPIASAPASSFLTTRWGPKANPESGRSSISRSKPRRGSLGSVSGASVKKGSMGKVLDKPVTFNKKVKSSGYGESASHQAWKSKPGPFQDKSNTSRTRKSGTSGSRASGGGIGRHLREYPVGCGPLVIHQAKHALASPPHESGMG